MDFKKREKIYKIIMLILITSLITFMITAVGVSRFYEKTEIGIEKVLCSNTCVIGVSGGVRKIF